MPSSKAKLGIAIAAVAVVAGGGFWILNTGLGGQRTAETTATHTGDGAPDRPRPTVIGSTTSNAGPELIGQMKTFKMTPITQPRPAATWKDANGKEVSLADFDGKVVMLNFWASWCLPCIRELPSVNKLQAGLGGDKFTVVALNIDQGGKPVANRFKRKLKLDKLDLYMDQDNSAAKSLKLRTMPTTIIFDAKGREVGKVEGSAEWNVKETLALIQWFIDNPGHADTLPRHKGRES